MRPKKWTMEQLKSAAAESASVRQVLGKLGLKQAGGNYTQITKYLKELNIDRSHFKGKAWLKGMKITTRVPVPLEQLLTENNEVRVHDYLILL